MAGERSAGRPAGAPGADWGQGIGYPAWIEPFMPRVHAGFNVLNRWFAVPVMRMGLGPLWGNPFTGYIMLLRTRGRKSGQLRDAPLGYIVLGDAVYCMAGFGRGTHWFQNVLADPRVEVILPGRSFSGIAEEVTDPEQRRAAMVPLVRCLGGAMVAMGLGNPTRQTAEEIEASCAGFPLVRIRPTGIAAGPSDPGGLAWAVPVAASVGLAAWLVARRLGRRRAASRGCACGGRRAR